MVKGDGEGAGGVTEVQVEAPGAARQRVPVGPAVVSGSCYSTLVQ